MLVCDDREWIAVCDRAGYFPTNSLDAEVVCYEFNLAGEGAEGDHCMLDKYKEVSIGTT